MTIYCIWGFIFLSFFFVLNCTFDLKGKCLSRSSGWEWCHWEPWDIETPGTNWSSVTRHQYVFHEFAILWMNEWWDFLWVLYVHEHLFWQEGTRVTSPWHIKWLWSNTWSKLKPGSKTQCNTHWQAVGIWQKHAKICYTPCIHTPIC